MKFILFFFLYILSSQIFALSFNEVQELIEKNNSDANSENDIKTVEDFIKVLPEDYKNNFALMIQSKSLQTSNAKNPRVIMYGLNRRTIYTFNSEMAYNGGNAIELMDTVKDGDKTVFQFREMAFNEGKVSFSEPNPAKCIKCHTHNTLDEQYMRPNWQPFFRWQGALGSNDDVLGLPSEDGQKELQAYREMQKSFPTKKRYRFLNINNFVQDFGNATLTGHANSALTSVLTQLNYERIVTRLMSTSYYPYFKYALYGANSCEKYGRGRDRDIEAFKNDFLPKELVALHDSKFTKDMRYDFLNENFQVSSASPVMPLINYVLGPLGENTFYWSMNFMPRHILPDPRFQTVTNSRMNLAGVFNKEDRDLRKVVRQRVQWANLHGQDVSLGESLNDSACEELANISQKTLAEFLKTENYVRFYKNEFKKLPNKNIQACIGCHSVGNFFAPEIPFYDESILKQALSNEWRGYGMTLLDLVKHKVSTGRMPLGISLTPMQREEVIQYFENLAQ